MPYPDSYIFQFQRGIPTGVFAQALSNAFRVPLSRVGVLTEINDKLARIVRSRRYDVFAERLISLGDYEAIEIFDLRESERWAELRLLKELCRLMRVEGMLGVPGDEEAFHVVLPDGSDSWVEIDLEKFLNTGVLKRVKPNQDT